MKEKIVLTILGSDNFDNYSFFEEKIYEILTPYLEKDFNIIIKERETNKTDNFSICFCNENNFSLERIKLNWKEFGKAAFWNNIKELVYGDIINTSPTDILIIFISEKDSEKDLYTIEKVLEEYNSCITDTKGNPSEPEVYIFSI